MLRWLPLVAVASAVLETAVILPYDRFYRSPFAPSVWSGGSSGSTLQVEGALLESWLVDLADAVPAGTGLAVVPREAEYERLLSTLERLGRLPTRLRPAKEAEAACLGLAHLPESLDEAALTERIASRHEVIRYMLHEVPLFRVVCGAPKASVKTPRPPPKTKPGSPAKALPPPIPQEEP
jgi:hypothetical protein